MGDVLEMLPKCELVRCMAEKAAKHAESEFHFLGRLNDLRERVSNEVSQINRLFPEYTPHDEKYHLSRLFHVADKVLGTTLLEGMYASELFLLGVGLYGHDWGMAVSDVEKQYILTGTVADGRKAEDLWILRNERERFAEFAREVGLSGDAQGRFDDVPLHHWQEYVRRTHAERSGRRVHRFFEETSGAVARAGERICVGHWLEIEDLEDPKSYPPDFPVLGEAANLRALAVYVRLIDLLDFSEDRTPFVIWMFVSPRDEKSQMEWKKHRAMQEIAVAPYQAGRIIRAEGSTDDHEVYAALEDLRVYCQEQFRGCSNVLARMNDPRHKLDIFDINWVVTAIGFKPISIRFEFDRDRMFEILSDEIYQGDSYVFLRELVQNSIDAIRLRRALLEKEAGAGNLGVIRVDVEHGKDGDAKVTVTDDGSGMDEHIVRNYLAVAGKSYYRSQDFERLGLQIDPISRFGIGLLSCFMVADRVEIETCRDPYFSGTSEALKIEIPAVRRQFRVEQRARGTVGYGTKITVHVKGSKLPKAKGEKAPRALEVTEYLSKVAGFVEYPLVITEGDRKTIVLHPKQEAEGARKRFGADFAVRQLDLSYPWAKTFFAQDMEKAKRVFREHRYDLGSDLGLTGYDGVLSVMEPSAGVDLVREAGGASTWDRNEPDPGSEKGDSEPCRWDQNRPYRVRYEEGAGTARSCMASDHCTVYRDGILVAGAHVPGWLEGWRYGPPMGPPARLVVNIPKSDAPRLDLARSEILALKSPWDAAVHTGFLRYLNETVVKGAFALPVRDRLTALCRLVAYTARADWLWEVASHDLWPVPMIEVGGTLGAIDYQVAAQRILYGAPYLLSEGADAVVRPLAGDERRLAILKHWSGEPCVFRTRRANLAPPAALASIADVAVAHCHRWARIRFLMPPKQGSAPLVQEVLVPVDCAEILSEGTMLEGIIRDPRLGMACASSDLVTFGYSRFTEFSEPFADAFGYGLVYINVKHPTGRDALRCAAALDLALERKSASAEALGRLSDAREALSVRRSVPVRVWCQNLGRFLSLGAKILDVPLESDPDHLGELQFVPDTVTPEDGGRVCRNMEYIKQGIPDGPYGQVMTTI